MNNVHLKVWDGQHLDVTGFSDSGLVEVVEATQNVSKPHPFYIGVQYHPEYKTRYDSAHPLFVGLLRAAMQLRT